MLLKEMRDAALFALTVFLLSASPAPAQTPSLENGQGMTRNWTNLASFTSSCIDRNLLDKAYEKYARFGTYLGGFLLGSLYRGHDAANEVLAGYLAEGMQGRVHEFDESGTLVAYDVAFTTENCAKLSSILATTFDRFAKSVLEQP